MLFETAVAAYWEDKSRRLRGNTLEGYASAIRCHLMPASARPSYNQDALPLANVEGSTSPLYVGVKADGSVIVTNRGTSARYAWGIACLPL